MNIQLARIDNWKPAALLKSLGDEGSVKGAHISCGGEHGVALVFTTDINARFTYTMPNVALAVRAVMKASREDRKRFPLKLIYETKDRAVFQPA